MNKKIVKLIFSATLIFFVGMIILPKNKIAALDEDKEVEFRATWVSPVHGDDIAYTNEISFKSKMNNLLDVLEYYNLNAIIFHIRTYNDAFYNTNLSPKMTQLGSPNFDVFDPLEWLIAETHSRGIEFHAWLNPYRVKSSGVSSLETLAQNYSQYPLNPASDAKNLLKTAANGAVLNPGIPEVRSYIVDTVKEIVENYDVDAIHFDDYFYANMGAAGNLTAPNMTILDELDQETYQTYSGNYDVTSAKDKADWRREQVNLLIQSIDNMLENFNVNNNRFVQFGIAPTGIYKNGNGVVTYDTNGKPLTNGSKTSGQTHYSSYLFCDSLKWISEGWLDYILPQSYWSQTLSAAKFSEVMGWWDKVCKNLNVNLYSGIGVYRANDSGSTDNGWETNENELYEQLHLVRNYENVQGASIYKYGNLKEAYNYVGETPNMIVKNISALKSRIWQYKAVLPEIKSMNKIVLDNPDNFTNNNDNSIKFDRVENAKFYYIYKSIETVKYSKETLYKSFSNINSVIEFIDNDNSNTYKYGIKVLSKTNGLNDGTNDYFDTRPFKDGKKWENIEALKNDLLKDFNIIKGTNYTLETFKNHTSTGYNMFAANSAGTVTFFQSENMREKYGFILTALKENRNENSLPISGFDDLLSKGFSDTTTYVNVEMVAFLAGMLKEPVVSNTTYTSSDYSNSEMNNNVLKHITEKVYCQVYFYDENNNLLKYEKVLKNNNATPPILNDTDTIKYNGWNKSYENVETNLEIYANYIVKKSSSCTISSYNQNYDVSVSADGIIGTDLQIDYGTLISVNCEKNDYFMFVTIDGFIYSYDTNFEFYATKNHEIIVYYSLENQLGVAFVDANRYLLDFQNANIGSNVISASVPSIKQDSVFNGWTEINNIQANKIVYATYTQVTGEFNLEILNGFLVNPGLDLLHINIGTIIEINTNLEDFTCWKIDNKIISYNRKISLSIYDNLTIEASNELVNPKDLIEQIYMLSSNNNYQFSAKFENLSSNELIEVGIVYHRNNMDPLESANISKKRIHNYNKNNEFVFSINLQEAEYFKARFYIVTKAQNAYITTYSDTFGHRNSGFIEYNTNGGVYLKYRTHNDLVDNFLVDLNNYRISLGIARNVTKETFFADTYNSITYIKDFLSTDIFVEKYQFIYDFIVDAGEKNGYIKQAQLVSKDNGLWRANLDSFLNQRDLNNTIFPNISSIFLLNYQSLIEEDFILTYNFGDEITLPILVKEGFVFDGWYETSDFSGNKITKIPSSATKDYLLYAKFI